MDSLLSKLEQAGAVIDQQGVVERFADAEHEAQCAVSGSAVALLNGLAAVQVSGADARGFLAGQLSSDIATLDSRHIQLSSWCSAQGRVLSAAWVLPRSAEQWLLIVPRDLADQMTKRLKMFVLRAKVTVELADDLVVLGVAGNTPDIIPQPADVLDLLTTDGLSVARIPGVDRRYLCIADLAQGEDLWTLLTTVLNPIGESAWRLLDIRAGLPRIDSRNTDRYLPQMLNLTALGAISFTKGCYPGQEIVARLRYRGTLKRRLYLAVCTASANPAPGDRIVLNDDPGQAVGDVVDAQRLADHCYLTAVIDIAAAEAGTLRLQSSGSIDLLDLPYALE